MKKIIIACVAVLLFSAAIFIVFKASKKRAPVLTGGGKISISLPALISQAKMAELKKDLIKAKELYQKLINDFPASEDAANWQKKIEEINIKLIFSTIPTSESVSYVVKPGDTLAKIAKEFNTTADLIIKSNGLADDRIATGRKLKIWTKPLALFVDKSQNVLILKTRDEEIIKTYTVSTGVNNCTPVGTFKIVDKIPDPPWFKPGSAKPIPAGSPENILGTRWLGFSIPGYGIHGTVEPQSLGKQVTQGCVRMANADVEELYTIVPKGTEVTIVD